MQDRSVDRGEVVALVTVYRRLELVKAKDQITDEDNNIKSQGFDAEHIGETARRQGIMLTEHRKTVQASNFKSAISEQVKSTRHSTN